MKLVIVLGLFILLMVIGVYLIFGLRQVLDSHEASKVDKIPNDHFTKQNGGHGAGM
ncbi:hypothetical protein [Bacillus sp. FJAT-42315]|uniref:hypothetical protein n=1 Tax=Bacillus sp. FJAT-42315 TaxID=2014077 RepID=UPI0012FF2BAE|nr:hypothetical protein [Bacillus sp. FJAT-42315]